MPAPPKAYRRAARILAASALVLWLGCVGLFLQYAATRPRRPQPDEGRIYSINNHGAIAYLNQSENMWLCVLAVAAFTVFVVAVVIDR